MVKVIGVRFRTAGKIYFFDPLNLEIKKGDNVIVETARGVEFGTVVSGIRDVEEEQVVSPLKPVIRIAVSQDIEQEAANRAKEKEAFRICLEKIKKHGLDMKLINAEYTFDNNKVLFYFTADGRIDFRELVKDLASVFKTRIELRQIGVRDETKMVGGIGICGRPLCCHSYLADFVPVSIKMAKEQNLSLNPAKISGVCGRLMCCLKNEEETYEELNRRLPGIGDSVTTKDGLKGEVHSVNVLRQLVKVVVDVGDEKEIKEYQVEQLYFRRRHGRKEKLDLSKEELWELERLEEEEEQEAAPKKEGGQRQGGRGRQEVRQEVRQEAEPALELSQPKRQESGRQQAGRQSGGRFKEQEQNQRRSGRQKTQEHNAQEGVGRQGGGKTTGKRQDSDQRYGGKHSETGFKNLLRHYEGATESEVFAEEELFPAAGQRRGGRYRQGNNNSRSRGKTQRQDNRNRQGGKDGKNRQEGQPKANDSQA